MTHLFKAIIINLQKMNKSNQNHGQPINNELLNFAHTVCHTCKTHGYGLLFYNVLILCGWNFGILNNYVLKTKNPLNEWNVILIYYVMDFLKSQNCNYFKSHLKHFKIII
jgi:hypothetical protein